MTPIAPPRLAVWLLRRHLSHNEPLAGDLLEEFERRESRLWLWWQVLAAITVTAIRRPEEVRPLHLVDERISPLVPRPTPALRRINTNGGLVLTASPRQPHVARQLSVEPHSGANSAVKCRSADGALTMR